MKNNQKHYKGYSIRKRGDAFWIRVTFKGKTYSNSYVSA